MNKYITIETNGYDKVGTAECKFDEKAFERDYADKIEAKSSANEEILLDCKFEADWKVFDRECIKYILDKRESLSNGDTIKVTWENDDELAEEAFGVKLKYSDIEQKVDNLQATTELNPFDYAEPEYSGASSEGTVQMKLKSANEAMNAVSFSFDKSSELKEGDQITVTASVDSEEDFAQKYGMILSETEKTYTVPKLDKYVTDISEIPTDIINEMDAQFRDELKSQYAEKDYKEIKDMKLVANYVLSLKDGMKASYGDSHSYSYFVYKVSDYDSSEKTDYSYYWCGWYMDVLLKADGQCEYEKKNYDSIDSTNLFSDDYESLDSLYKGEIVKNLDEYVCKEFIKK